VKHYPRLALVLIAFILYVPTLFFDYVYMDDYLMVQESSFYSKIENIPASFARSVWHPTGSEYNYYRPLSTSVYILGAWTSTLISGQIQPWIFHLTNVLLQAFVILLLFTLLRQLGSSQVISFIGSLVLIIHPLSAGTLGWIPGQNELLLAITIIGGFICYVRALKSNLWFLVHGFCFLAGMMTKENAVVLPVLCAMYLLFSPQRKQIFLWLYSLASWLIALALWLVMVNQGGVGSPFDVSNAFMSILHGLPFTLIYLGQFYLPLGLSTLPIPQDVSIHFWIAGTIGAAFMLVLSIWKWRERPLVVLGMCWFFGFLLPTFASMLPESKDTFILRSDRAYLAFVGLILVLTQIPGEQWSRLFAGRVAKIILCTLGLFFIGLNLRNQMNYSNGMAFYQSGVEGSPSSAFARAHLGDAYLFANNVPEAIKQYQAAIALNDYEPQAHNNLGVAYLRSGDMDKAAAEYAKELEFNPKNILAWSNLGDIYLMRGDYSNAELAFRKAVEINPTYRTAWLGLYKIYDFQKRYDKRDEVLSKF
jgi:protein O-mannosyl-transferase